VNPADAFLMDSRALARRDDVVEDLVRVRTRQDRLADRLPAPPNIDRLREATDVRAQYAELFADLELTPPAPRSDGNAVGERLAHLAELQPRFAPPEWRRVDLYRAAQAETKMLEIAEREIAGAARAKAADKSVGSLHRKGRLRPIHRTDAQGRRTTEWRGDPFDWMRMFMPATYDILEAYGTGHGKMRRPGQ
jgi:hypothetical protein